jgi:transposase
MTAPLAAAREEEWATVPESPPRAPFAQRLVTLTQQEHVQLKWDAAYWRTRHQGAIKRLAQREHEFQAEQARRDRCAAETEAALRTRMETLEARIRDLCQRLFGAKSEKTDHNERQQKDNSGQPARPRGQQPGRPGHGRSRLDLLPVVPEIIDLTETEKRCPSCFLPLIPFVGTQDCEVVEIEVQAYRRRIQRKRYRPSCPCGVLPGIVTAAAPSCLIPKGKIGLSIWVEALLDKFLSGRPTHRLLQAWAHHGLNLSQGTLIGGFKTLAPLLLPVVSAITDQQRHDPHWHADETGWRVFESLEGKAGHRWYLWVFHSASAVVMTLDPHRAATVPEAHFQGLTTGIVICDRYSAYKKLARTMGFLLAFCWAHVRRDFLTLARGYPEQEAWAMAWVARIGTLYTLNNQRLAATEDRVAFDKREIALHAHLQRMVDDRDAALQDPLAHPAVVKVLTSLRRHWPGLVVFVDHPEIPLDNNVAERALRGPVVGRKNYYGSGSRWAGEFAASMFTVLMTLQLWQINPRRWFTEYGQACAENGRSAPADLSPFLPWAMTPERYAAWREPAAQQAPHDTS